MEIAYILAERGYSLALVARSGEKLEKIAAAIRTKNAVDVLVLPFDLCDPTCYPKIAEALHGKPVEVLINNAGFGAVGHFAEMDAKVISEMIQLNIAALTGLTRIFLPQMLEAGKGKIMNVASTAAFQPGPLMAVYFATKAYVLSLSEALHNELEGSGVTVTALCPGPTISGFQERAKMKDSKMLQYRTVVMDSRTVAEQGVKALFESRPVLVTGILNRIVATSIRFVPRSFVTRISRKFTEAL